MADLSKVDPSIWAALIGAGGGFLSGMGQGQLSDKDRDLQQRLAIANFLTGQDARDRTGATIALQAQGGPFEASGALQRMLTTRDLLSNLGNVDVQPPGEFASYMPKVSGGMRIPEGGLDLRSLSDNSLAESARNFYSTLSQVNPGGTTPNLSTLGLGTPGAAASNSVEAFRQGQLDQNKTREAQIMQHLQGPPKPAGGGGFMGKLGGILKFAAPIAAAFIPGVGPLAAAAISGGAGVAGTKMQGGSWGDALKSGAIGAGTGLVASRIPSPFRTSIGKGTAAAGGGMQPQALIERHLVGMNR